MTQLDFFPASGRKIAQIQGAPGPLLILIGGIHGNEPTGIAGIQRAFEQLRGLPFKGHALGLRGNLPALDAGCRALDLDLNRLWLPEIFEALKRRSPAAREERELLALSRMIEEAREAHGGPAYLLDLHTTSGESPAFSISRVTPFSRQAHSLLRVPVIIDGAGFFHSTIASYYRARGWGAFGFEGGLHHSKESIQVHSQAILSVMSSLGMLEEVPEYCFVPEELVTCYRVIYRHDINAEDHWRTQPGLKSFQAVKAGQLLGEDRRGPVYCPQDGYLFMPLYQSEGFEGFFLLSSEVDRCVFKRCS